MRLCVFSGGREGGDLGGVGCGPLVGVWCFSLGEGE